MSLSQSEIDEIKLGIQQEMGFIITDEEAQLFCNNPADFLVQMQNKMQAGELEFSEDEDDGGEHEQPEHFFQDDKEHTVDGQVVGKALIQRLYKQLAKRLHPDLEQDPEQKKIKHKQMQQVLAAKAENDIYTLLELHQQHFDTDALGQLENQELNGINQLLRQQLASLKQQYDQLFMDDSIEAAIWRRFRNRGNISVDQNFAKHKQGLNSIIARYNELLKQLKTLKDLKQLQEGRHYF